MDDGSGTLESLAMNVRSSFWRGKRVFLTGHTGFKGGWLAHWLVSMGAHVRGYALQADGSPNLFSALAIEECITSHVIGDIRDGDLLQTSLQGFSPDIVLHLAAQPLVRASYKNPIETYETNVVGTLKVLEAIRQCSSVRAAVCITTDKVYDNKEWLWGYRETDRLGGHDPYSSSKACCELAVDSYRKSFLSAAGIGVATARAGNVVGGGDWSKDRLVPDAVRAFAKSETVSIRNPASTRPWQHVIEPLRGYLMLAEALWEAPQEFSDSFNFGPRSEGITSVANVMTSFCQSWGEGATWKDTSDTAVGPHEARALSLDISRAEATLNWQPQFALEKTLELTADWYRTQASGAQSDELKKLTDQQIAQANAAD